MNSHLPSQRCRSRIEMASCARRELALQAAHSPACECRSGLQTARRCCLFNALHPAPVPDADSIPDVSLSKQKAHHKGELFVLLVGRRHPNSHTDIGLRGIKHRQCPHRCPLAACVTSNHPKSASECAGTPRNVVIRFNLTYAVMGRITAEGCVTDGILNRLTAR